MTGTEDLRETTILLIDDDPAVHNLIDFHLEGVVDRVLHAHHPVAGLLMAKDKRPDTILLDLNMPFMDGFEVCRELKESELTRDLPVLFLTVNDSVYKIARALDIGGSDYVTKPFAAVELQARVRAALRTRRLIEMLRIHARIDALTGLRNRGALDEAVELAATGFARNGNSYAVLIIDVDHFKRVNDTYGHGIGDEVLRKLGNTIAARCRPGDFAARYGGEEFALILNDVKEPEATAICERLLVAIKEIRVATSEVSLGITCSGGLSMVDQKWPSKGAMGRADDALYQAKESGRNQIMVWMAKQDAPLVS
jgi:diguanylate cyclase (GGDEF)-like protein